MSGLEAVCRNCRNTGISWQGDICVCRYGREMQQTIERADAKLKLCTDCAGSGLLGDGYVCKRCDGKGRANHASA